MSNGEGAVNRMLQSVEGRLASSASTGKALHLKSISHRFGDTLAVDDVTLDVRGGELVALLGPSGCGKTTLLRAIGGFIRQTSGAILIDDAPIDHLLPNKRAVGIVFQNYALFPHMTAAQNIAYGLDARGSPGKRTAARVQEMLALVQLAQFGGRYPRELSGGQQQRIALARALAVEPAILLLDEPFAALDKNLRLGMQIEIKRIQRLSGTTCIIVTHDQEEALSMADRVAVLNKGRLEQFATPAEVYDHPRSLFVNTFVGTANVLRGTVRSVDGSRAVVAVDAGFEIRARLPEGGLAAGDAAVVCIRPEQLRILTGAAGMTATVEMGLPLGATIVHELRLADGTTVKISEPRAAGAEPLATGTRVTIAPVSAEAATAFRQP